ncbi:hypothetical protein SAMN05421788_110142 [Filimonas lacunae]|uniref:Lipocalin-like domain-containing protein n=1 Tax=Filimonas lacunae TaxID=477680 RepID=A0A173MA39_9BACT|nr:hypothetical protein [Filimonas lacunae]BAV04413.1 hypothetical protein FLA_0402 [Filimonas lacunae]SIT31347.1 hypothetical protein SAMN05421788_110142 [Filimonas lacunae]
MVKHPKYLFIAFIAFVSVAFTACGPTKGITNSEKWGYSGTWFLNNIHFEGIPAGTKFKATVFDDVPYSCLQGSQWNLQSNGKGSYVVNASASECIAGERFIFWSTEKSGQSQYFQFKRVDGGVKPKNVTTGYRMEVSALNQTSMQLRSPINFEGNTVYIVYDFSKQ